MIVGGGMSGLTAGVALKRNGVDALVFEQVDDLRKSQVGAGLALGYNVARAFNHLGLLDDLREVAAPIRGQRYMTDKGRVLGTAEVSKDGELVQGTRRPLFHRFLLDSLGADRVRSGSSFVRFEQDAESVTAHFADGSTAVGDVLIGADGMNSATRRQLLGDSEPRYAGYCTRRGVVETDIAEEGLLRIALGSGQRFVSYPVGRRHVYWTAVVNAPPGGGEEAADRKRAVLELFQGWTEPVEELVEATDESDTFFCDIYDRDPVDRWGEGRVTLLGDAAHPMTFDLGQGAGQGIEGAVLLAKRLGEGGDPVASLRAWEAERIPRTSKFVLRSRKFGAMGQSENALTRALRNEVVTRVVTSSFGMKRAAKELQVEY